MLKNKWMILLLAIVLLFVAVFTLFYTTAGSKVVSTCVSTNYVEDDGFKYKSMSGSIATGLTLTDIEITNIKDLPEDTAVYIDQLWLKLTSMSLEGLQVQVDNLRLYLAEADPIQLTGSIEEQRFDIHVESKKITDKQILAFVPSLKDLGPIESEITDVNVKMAGHLEEPTVTGTLNVDTLSFKDVKLVNTRISVDTRIKDYKDNIQIHGNLSIKNGEVHTTKGKVSFDNVAIELAGPVKQPQLNANVMTIEHLEVSNIINLPQGATLRGQRLTLKVKSWDVKGIDMEVENARVSLPNADPIVMSGAIREEVWDLNVYSRKITVTEVLAYLPNLKQLIPLKGDVANIDLYITGNYLEPNVTGSFTVDTFVYKGFVLSDAPLTVDMALKDLKTDTKLHGQVSLERGKFKTPKVLVNLDRGDLYFSGPWNDPRMNLNGESKIEKTEIKINIKGTTSKPELNLSSEPSYSKQKLMVMLATGKSWQSVEGALENGISSTALTKDFIDYFFFAGKSNQFAKKFGITEFSVTYNENSKGIGAKKELSDKLEVGYQVEQSVGQDQQKDVRHTLEGEYKVNKNLSVSVEREMRQEKFLDDVNKEATENNDKVMIKYKKSF